MNLNKIISSAKKSIVKKSPEILIGIGIAGFISSAVLAVKETPKAIKLLEEAQEEKGGKLTNVEKVKATWKCYAPSAGIALLSASSLISSRAISSKRGAALATAYALSESTLATYKDKVIETIGEKKEKEIREKINEDKLKNNPIENKEIIITGNGKSLCYESISGRYFESDIESIKHTINKLNRRMTQDMYVSLADLYEDLGLEQIKNSEHTGWNLNDGLIEVWFDTKMCTDGRPAIVLDYNIYPRYDYNILG